MCVHSVDHMYLVPFAPLGGLTSLPIRLHVLYIIMVKVIVDFTSVGMGYETIQTSGRCTHVPIRSFPEEVDPSTQPGAKGQQK